MLARKRRVYDPRVIRVRGRLLEVCVAAIAAAGCSGGGGAECGPGTREEDGVCVAALPDAGAPPGCGPGTVLGDAGVCVVPDRPIDRRSCAGRFGPIPEDAPNTIYVDAAYTGADTDGSAARPFATIQVGVDAAPAGGTVAIASGTYPGVVAIGKPLAVEGRCAREVVIEGSVSVVGTGDVAIRGVTVRGGAPGVAVRTSAMGAGVELRYVLLEANASAGLLVERSRVVFTEGEIRGTTVVAGSDLLAELGAGVFVFDGSDVVVSVAIIDMNQGVGIDVADATGTAADAVATADSVATIDMNRIADNAIGVRARAVAAGRVGLPAADAPAVTIAATEIVGHPGYGVEANNARLSVSASRIAGNGDAVGADVAAGVSVFTSRVVIAVSTIEDNFAHGVYLLASSGQLIGNTVALQRGVGVRNDGGEVTISSNTVRDNQAAGILAIGGIATIDMNQVVGNGAAWPHNGIDVTGATFSVIRDNTVTGATHAGIRVFGGASALVESNEVAGTLGVAGRGIEATGHGIYVQSTLGARLLANFVHDNAGAGMSGDAVDADPAAGRPFIIDMNMVVGNGFAGINVQGTGSADVVANGVAENGGYGIRVIGSGLGGGVVVVAQNDARDTVVSSFADDGDGIAVIGAAADVTLNTGIGGNARAGILASDDTVGIIDMNNVGIIDMNLTADILVQTSPGVVVGAANTTAMPPTISVTAVVGVNAVYTTLFDMP